MKHYQLFFHHNFLSRFAQKAFLPLPLIVFLLFFGFFMTSKSGKSNDNGKISSLNEEVDHLSGKHSNQPPDEDYYQKNFIKYGDFVYQNNIKSVLFNRKNWELSPPIIEMNSLEKLVLRFDDMDADFKNYAYTIIHCNAMWKPSDLQQYEYIEGFYEDRIDDYNFSVNTRVPFTHYHLEFPNNNMKPIISGNYILKIFVDGDPDDVVITKRFMVLERLLTANANVKQATNLEHRKTHQEIDFTINTSGYLVSNPYRDLRVVITQNGRWDNAVYDLQPRLVQGNELIYDYEDENLFPGINEFRSFDIKSLRYRSLNVNSITTGTEGWLVELQKDQSRQFLQYTSREDINGQFLIKTEDYNDDFLESDYAYVDFFLALSKPITQGNVYVMGDLTNWNFTPLNKMKYNYQRSGYELTLLLKQGFYDYMYGFLEDGAETADLTRFEGSHSFTENNYTIYIYHRKPGDFFDSLIGITHLNSSVR